MIPSRSAQPSPSSNGRNLGSGSPLYLPEVQSAMLEHLQSNSSEWATPDLLDSITQYHPKLARGMSDPRYMAALQGMRTNPKETLERLKKTSPDVVDWLMEFCGVMGEHFVKLGEGRGGGRTEKRGGREKVPDAAGGDEKIREIGPLEKRALDMHQKQKSNYGKRLNEGRPNMASETSELDDQVSSILSNDELRSILLDPQMQRIMEECSTGNKLRYYMSHEEYGPKLRTLMGAGLIQLA